MVSRTPSRRARIDRIEAEAEALIRDPGDRAFHEARLREHEASSGAIARDWADVALRATRAAGSASHLNSVGDEYLFRARSRTGRGARASTLFGARRQAQARCRPDSTAVPDSISRHRVRFRTLDIEGSRDSRVRCVRRHHRRRNGPAAAYDGRIANTRSRRPRSFQATES